MHESSHGPLHAFVLRIYRNTSEWLISRGLATQRLRWRVTRFERQGFSALFDLSDINYPYAFIAANVIMMVIVLLFSVDRPERPGNFGALSGLDSVRFGAAFTPAIFAGQYWRYVTAMFLHGDFMHLLFNCVAILIIAPKIEEAFGPRRFLLIYILAGIAGNVVSVYVRHMAGQPVLLVGASGAVYGLLGAGAIHGHKIGGPQGNQIFKFMIAWIVLGILYSFLHRGDNFAHAGGAIAGGIIAQLLRPHAQSSYNKKLWQALEIGCLTLVAACFVLMLHSLFTYQLE